MAIEIKVEKKTSEGVEFWESALMVVSMVFLAIAAVIFVYFSFFLNPQKADQLVKANDVFASLTDPEIVNKEAELNTAQKEIDDFKLLYENNPKTSAFFDAFQDWAQPDTVYADFSLDVPTRKVALKGVAKGFQDIIQQMAILRAEASVGSFRVSNIALSEAGGVSFDLDVFLKADLFK